MAAVLDSVRAALAPNDTFIIDAEAPADIETREVLLDRAMGPDRRRKSSEKIRRNRLPADGLSLVARDPDGNLVGTVRLWHIEAGISPDGMPIQALLLGPLAVDPDSEGRGIGGALMRAAIREAHHRNHGAIVLVGDPEYYERFGFFSDKAQHLLMPGPFQRARFLALELKDGWLAGATGMVVASGQKIYC